jgi:plant 4alpha-monomethylsterol monooxygenase
MDSLARSLTELISPHDDGDLDLQLYNRLYFTVGTWCAHSITFWILNILLFVCYHQNYFLQYRIQKELPSSDLIWECLKHNLLSHFIITPLLIYLVYPSFLAMGMSMTPVWPPIQIILRDLLVAVLVNDTLFYWAHRAFHHPAIYKHIHKKHHTFKSNIGIASEFAHPVEDLIANVIPTIGGCFLMGSHVYVLWLWLVIRVLETVDAHSGYSFPLSPFHLLSFQVPSPSPLSLSPSSRAEQSAMTSIIRTTAAATARSPSSGTGSPAPTCPSSSTKSEREIESSNRTTSERAARLTDHCPCLSVCTRTRNNRQLCPSLALSARSVPETALAAPSLHSSRVSGETPLRDIFPEVDEDVPEAG